MQHFMQRLIAVRCEVAFNALRINHAAVREHDGALFLEERRVEIGLRDVRLAAFECGDDGRRVLRRDFDVE
jgi:hypothetical protein